MNLDLSWDGQSMWNGKKWMGGGAEKDNGGGSVARLGRSRIGSKPARYVERRVELGGSWTRVNAALRTCAWAVALELALCEVEWEVEVLSVECECALEAAAATRSSSSHPQPGSRTPINHISSALRSSSASPTR